MSARHLKAPQSKRTIGVLSVFALLAPLFLITPSVTATGGPSVTAPAAAQFVKSTANQDPGDFVISGFAEGELLVTIGLVNPPTGTNFSISSTVGATHSTGYTSWVNLTEVSFKVTSTTGRTSQQNANDALASMTVSTGATAGDVEFRVSVMPLDPGIAFNPVTQHAYSVGAGPVTWGAARTLAAAATFDGVNGYLATITSEQENNFITDNIPSASNIWIGATDEAVEGTWRWVTGPEGLEDGGLGRHFWTGQGSSGTAMNNSFVAWASGEPNNGGDQHYALTNWGSEGLWDDQDANAAYSYLIEYSQGAQSFTSLRSASVKIPMLRVTYNENQDQHQRGGTLGSVPVDSSAYLSGATVTVLSSTLTRTGFTFAGWQVSGTNTRYQVGDEFTISTDLNLNAHWEIPKAARLIGLTTNTNDRTETIVPVTNGGALVPGNIRGITTDGEHIYFIPSNKSGFIRQVDFDGTNVVDHAVPQATALDSRDLTYSNGCIFVRKMKGTDTTYRESDLLCIDTSTWTAVEATVPAGNKFDAGQGWLRGNLVDFPDGRIGAVSNATDTVGRTDIPNCPDWAYCKVLRLYSVSVDRSTSPVEVDLTWSEDLTLADIDSNWPNDDHGIATDGTYLYQSHHTLGYKVFGLASGSTSFLVFNGDGDGNGSTCGADDGVSGFVCSINPNPSSVSADLTNPAQAVINNATYFSRDHVNQRYIMGDYGSPRFFYTESAPPPAGLGSIEAPGSPTGITATAGSGSATVSWAAPAVGGPVVKYTVTSNPGGFTCVAFSPATSCEVTGLANGTSYTFSVVAQNGSGASTPSSESAATTPSASAGSPAPAAAPSPPSPSDGTGPATSPAPTPSANPGPTIAPPPVPAPLTGPPVLAPPTNGGAAASVGGEPVTPETLPRGAQELDVNVGDVGLTFNVPNGSGGVQNRNGQPQLDVRRDQSVNLNGGGLLPGSTVQVWLPGATGGKEISRISVGADGEFDGEVSFRASASGAPLPIGEQVVQLTGVDGARNQVVFSMSINISQPTPAPELFRGQTTTPKPGIGNFIVSKAGLDEAATLTGLEDLKQALIEGTGWQMGLTLTGEASQLTNDGEAVRVTLVKGENAAFTGSGFMPGTLATVWLFSEPNLLGEVSVDSDGSFDGTSIAFPENLTAGEHTVQIQAVGSDGFIRSANIGVEVRNPSSAAAGFWSILGWLPPVLLGLLVLGAIWLVAISRRRGRRTIGSNVIQFPRAA